MKEFNLPPAQRHKNFITWVGLLGLNLLLALGTSSVTSAQEPFAYLRLVRVIDTGKLGIANPVGLAFSPAADVFLLSQARKPDQTDAKITMITFFDDPAGSVTVPQGGIPDPLNVAFDSRANRLALFDQAAKALTEIQATSTGYLEPSAETITRVEAQQFGLTNPQGMTFDPTGRLFVLDAAGPRIVRISPNSRLKFDVATAARDNRILPIELNHLADAQPRGVAFNPNTNHLYVLSSAKQTLYELTEAGQVVATRDLSFLELRDPQGMVFAPSGDLTDDPALMSLYIADSGQMNGIQGRGQIVELSLTAPPSPDLLGAAEVQPSLVNTIKTSKWSPPSPDPMGMAYISSSGRLMVSDSEVEEMSIFKRVNVFESTLPGTLAGTFRTTSFSNEPTGVAFNPSNHHLFFSDDDAYKVFEIDPGADGDYFTSDDIRTSFDTRAINCRDPEGIAYDSWQGHLFIVDGVNAEVYEIKPGPNGIFDGQPPAGDDQKSQFDTKTLGILDPEGIEFNSDNGHLYITGNGATKVVETTTTGTLISVIDISSTKVKKASGLAYAPGSVNPAVMNLYISDRGVDNNTNAKENDGKVYEISFPSLSINDVSVTDGNATQSGVNAIFTVTLFSPNDQIVTVDYATADGTATAGSDYVAISGTLTFSAGTTTQTIAVVVKGEALDEPNKIFFVNLSNPTNATITDNQGRGTIIDDDPSPSISINDVTVTEGNASQGGVNAVFTATLSAASGQVVTVDYATANGIATAGSDYVASSGTVNFPAGTTTQTITVVVNGDEIVEPNETFFVDLSNPSNATIADNQGLGTITDDDSLPSISINDVSVTEGNAPQGGVNAVFTVTLSSTSSQVVTVDYATADGTATAGSDYVAGAGTVTFSAGTTTQTIAVVVNGEELDEPNETFFVNLSNPANATIADNQGQGTITDDDPAPSISINDVTVTESNASQGGVNAVFTATLSAASGLVVTIDYATVDGTATAGNDYMAGAGTVNFAAGATTQTITVVVIGDEVDEPNETFFVSLSNPTNATIADSRGQGTINDDDWPPPIIASFSPISGPTGTEVTITGNDFTGATSVNFNRTPASTFTIDSPTQIRATVPSVATTGKISVTTPGGTATSASDFTVTITLSPTDDARVNSANPSTNYGSSSTLRLRKSSSTTINSYLKFNVSGLSGPVQSAKLRLYVTDSSKSGGSVHLVSNNYEGTTTTWVERGLNWNNAPAIGGAALSSAGAASVESWVEFDVTSAIAGEAIYSFGLKTTSSDAVYYSSKEGSNKPELVVQLGSGASLAARDPNFKLASSEQKNEAVATPLPGKLDLAPNYPNPFNAQSTIAYALPQETEVRLVIYNVLGRQVRQLVDEIQPAGFKRVFWNGRDNSGRELSSGIYFIHLVAGQQRLIRKITLMK
ncbi:DNRLRE domain-containing protein [candidate division KSB1 bacterium]|nr:DNRLRE domain-containing protein [candidate division KSB1 bacterium]